MGFLNYKVPYLKSRVGAVGLSKAPDGFEGHHRLDKEPVD